MSPTDLPGQEMEQLLCGPGEGFGWGCVRGLHTDRESANLTLRLGVEKKLEETQEAVYGMPCDWAASFQVFSIWIESRGSPRSVFAGEPWQP